jgi:hypothetical protein
VDILEDIILLVVVHQGVAQVTLMLDAHHQAVVVHIQVAHPHQDVVPLVVEEADVVVEEIKIIEVTVMYTKGRRFHL